MVYCREMTGLGFLYSGAKWNQGTQYLTLIRLFQVITKMTRESNVILIY